MSSPDNNDTTENIEIPNAVLTACPKHRFALVRVGEACPTCPHFAGLSDRFPGGKVFETRYAVRCNGEPVQRAIVRLAGVE